MKALSTTAALLALPLLALAGYLLMPLPVPSDSPRPAVQYFDRKGRLLYEGLEGDAGAHQPVRLADLSPFVAQATVAVEDAAFYDHPGVDLTGIARAAFQNLYAGRTVAGGSTITQQLARLLYFSPEERTAQTFDRKLREAGLALRLTRTLSKDQVLEQYLNRVYYGGLAYGVEGASRRVFGKPARDLDLAEAALLAGLPQSPAAYDPLQHPEAAKERQRTVLGLMRRAGMISKQQEQAAAEPLRFAPAAFPIRAPHFVQHVRTLLDDLIGPERAAAGGLRVVTTLDVDLQETAEAVVGRRLAELRDKQVSNAAVVALDPVTGEVLVLVGSASYFDRAIDGAVNMALALRQPGSAIKPVTYALALQRGFTAASTIYDLPTTFTTRNGQSYRPHNYDGAFHGPVTVREALARSLNLPAVAVLKAVGVEDMAALARRMGLGTLTDPARYDLSLTLGGGEVRLLDLTAAYAVFAANGVARPPAMVLRVEDTVGRVLYERPEPEGARVLPAGVAALITNILADNEARTPGFGAQSVLLLGDRPAAVKTGTTEDFRDNWTVGYTPDLVVGVWAGNADNTAMQESSGVTGAAPIWHDIMTAALAGSPPRAFTLPPELERIAVCEPWGLLPGPACPTVREELFLPGTAPRATEQVYRLVEECRVPELDVTRCPPGQTRQRVEETLPPEAAGWEAGSRKQEAGGDASPFPLPVSSLPPLRVRLGGLVSGATLHLTREVPLEAQRLEITVETARAVSNVELWEGDVLLSRWDMPPYRVAWQLRPGRHAFTAVAVDGEGKRVQSDEVVVTVVGP